MSDRELVLTFEDDGNVTGEVVGVKGPGCRAASQPYEDVLGLTNVQVTKKPEYTQAPDVVRQNVGG